ncbi:MAG: hypothetical protein WBQ72_08485 [Terriglobales bacterium]|jgi:hypothetical protein
MAANPNPNPSPELSHLYHAEAHILSGELHHPIKQQIEPYGNVVLANSRRETHLAQSVKETSIEGLISFKSGHTRVIGTQVQNKKDIFGNDHAGFITLATSVLEGLNVVDIVTADRVVAQASSQHAHNAAAGTVEHVPAVTFLGTRFENFRIGGYPVEIELDLEFCANKPKDDRSYLEDKDFLDGVERQFAAIKKTKGLPKDLASEYDSRIANIATLRKGNGKGSSNGHSTLQCSLVKSIGPIPIPGVKVFGNRIFIPNFGTIALAEIEVGVKTTNGGAFSRRQKASSPASVKSNVPSNSHYFTLHMFDMQLGCPVSGTAKGPGVTCNGNSGGPG